MKNALLLAIPLAAFLPFLAHADTTVKGHYVEARSCDVYTGACFANAEVNTTGSEAILVWSVAEGRWNGVTLDGLTVIAAVRASNTLGGYASALPAKSVLLVDARADHAQIKALTEMVRAQAGALLDHIVEVKTVPITASVGACKESGCATVTAEGIVEVSTRCLSGEDHLCGNEAPYYPPLAKVSDPRAAYTTVARYAGDALGMTWQNVDRRSAFLGTFSM